MEGIKEEREREGEAKNHDAEVEQEIDG